jgi:hypothetical protein
VDEVSIAAVPIAPPRSHIMLKSPDAAPASLAVIPTIAIAEIGVITIAWPAAQMTLGQKSSARAMPGWQLLSGMAAWNDADVSEPLSCLPLPVRGHPTCRVALSCFRLSLRDVALILAGRGIIVSYESVREWGLRFGLASTPSSIAQLAMPSFARGAVSPKLRLPRKIQRYRFCPSRARHWQPDNAPGHASTATAR